MFNGTCYGLWYFFNKTSIPVLPILPSTVKLSHIVSGRFSYSSASVAAIEANTIKKVIVFIDVGKEQSSECVSPNHYENLMLI